MGPAESFIMEAWTELAIGIVFILLRLYFRYLQVGLRGMTVDDFLMILAGALYIVETTAAYVIVGLWQGMANNNFTPEHRTPDVLVPGSQAWRYAVYGSKGHILGWFMYTGLIWTLKCCWTIYYSRMTDGVQKMDIRIKLAWCLNGATYIAALCMILFKCWPLHRQWQIYPDPGNNCYPGASKLNVSFITAINATTDMYLMAIPLPIIHRAKLDLKRKLSLFILFSGGWIVIAFGLLRCITLVTVGPTSPSESGQWSVRESFVAVLVSNTPMVFPLVKRWSKSLLNLSSHHGHADADADANGYPLADYQAKSKSDGSSRFRTRRGGFRHPLSIPNDTAWASDEAIVREGQEEEGGGEIKHGKRGSREVGTGVGMVGIVQTREWEVEWTAGSIQEEQQQ
ncbi:hypothetical protein ACEQ8H_004117 [Pleosporales sp. CAS-2024a]